ncbi:hypothetical protein ACHAWO_000999 [Cyclotella atomus]|uniref:ATP-dependent RNA helicase n=1 Tax=Cyclotella atomus TaxID=382360 RepID=A0ABD3PRI0_9STRA
MIYIKQKLFVALVVSAAISPSLLVSTSAFQNPTVYVIRIDTNLHAAPRSSSPSQRNKSRGANAANHNRRGHELRLNKDTRIKKKNTKRAPRWEREGDQLYAEISKQITRDDGGEDELSAYFDALKKDPIETVDDVHRFLKPWTSDGSGDEAVGRENIARQSVKAEEEKEPANNAPTFMWGSLPVGPVLASRLYASGRSSPTDVQKGAFPIITQAKRTNAIIASPTGTGKTLAYLLPLLCTSPGGQFGEGTGGVLIVTPTIELACQIQREVNVLWPPDETKGGYSACFAVGDVDDSQTGDDDSDWTSPGRSILKSITNSPIIAGTPKMLRMLYREANYVSSNAKIDRTISSDEATTARALLTNMRAIVLDEADRLLRTEAVAREAAERKERKVAQRMVEESDDESPIKKKRLIIARETQTEMLLRDLPIPSLQDVQIICASATVGRTMRRQLMQILDAPSADAAATLITGEDDARVKSKDSERRKSVLLPEKLQHSYKVVDLDAIEDIEDEGMSVAEQNEERMTRATVKSLWDTISSLEAKPILIFPGKIGVERIQQEFIAMGLEDVRTLRNLDGASPEYPPIESTNPSPWKSIPVYIIGERFARGLDLPNVEYVAMLSPPSSAAGYTHMAGRTGRVGRRGTAFTFVRPKNNEVKRLVAIAETLGIKFNVVSSDSETDIHL